MRLYGEDLAYIHDAGFSDYSRNAAPGLLALLRRYRIHEGLVVDLGCGGGTWAGILAEAGYGVLGIDQSAALIGLARKHVPGVRFERASLVTAALPPCDAVTSVGECLNYAFADVRGRLMPARFFRRVLRWLRPGGVFVFDFAEPSRAPDPPGRRHWTEGRDWAVLVETTADAGRRRLTRNIITFRKVGQRYRRSEERHSLRLYPAGEVAAQLTGIGFEVEVLRGFGQFALLPGMAAIAARKPGQP